MIEQIPGKNNSERKCLRDGVKDKVPTTYDNTKQVEVKLEH